MAKEMPKKAAEIAAKKPKPKQQLPLPFGPANFVALGASILVIIVGFILLAAGSMTVAPFLLVIGFSIMVPISIMLGLGKSKSAQEQLKEPGAKTN